MLKTQIDTLAATSLLTINFIIHKGGFDDFFGLCWQFIEPYNLGCKFNVNAHDLHLIYCVKIFIFLH
jgi:hypothetical protein